MPSASSNLSWDDRGARSTYDTSRCTRVTNLPARPRECEKVACGLPYSGQATTGSTLSRKSGAPRGASPQASPKDVSLSHPVAVTIGMGRFLVLSCDWEFPCIVLRACMLRKAPGGRVELSLGSCFVAKESLFVDGGTPGGLRASRQPFARCVGRDSSLLVQDRRMEYSSLRLSVERRRGRREPKWAKLRHLHGVLRTPRRPGTLGPRRTRAGTRHDKSFRLFQESSKQTTIRPLISRVENHARAAKGCTLLYVHLDENEPPADGGQSDFSRPPPQVQSGKPRNEARTAAGLGWAKLGAMSSGKELSSMESDCGLHLQYNRGRVHDYAQTGQGLGGDYLHVRKSGARTLTIPIGCHGI